MRVSGNVTALSGKTFTITYSIRNAADDAVVADGNSVCVWVDYSIPKAVPLPAALVEAIARIEEKTPPSA